jgi:hypothetical protein
VSDGRRVYVYEVEPCKDDARGTSGWTVTVVTDRIDMTDLLRVVRVHLASTGSPIGSDRAEEWTGIKSAKLLTTAVLDPRIAA